MNNTLNEKINQVDEFTLVLGVDIAKRKHYCAAVDDRGRLLENPFPVQQSRDGFEKFLRWIEKVKEDHEKTRVIVGMEPTGHYWMNLAYYLEACDIQIVIVNPMHVKSSKELDDNHPSKSDPKDAQVISRLVKDGRFSYPRLLEDVDAELRVGTTLKDRLQEEQVRIKNRISRFTDRYFPEFNSVFQTLGKMALNTLEYIPFPSDIVQLNTEELLVIYKEVGGMKSPQSPKVEKLIKAANKSIGIGVGLEMARIEIATLVRRYKALEEEIESLNEQVRAYVNETAEYKWLLTVPGLGEAGIIDLLSEVGSFTNYASPRQLIKLAGLALRENSSGSHKGQKRISRRGRKKLRKVLFRIMIPMLCHNEAFKKLHEYYTTRDQNPLKKKQSIVVLCGKLLKVLHAMVNKARAYDGRRLLSDSSIVMAS